MIKGEIEELRAELALLRRTVATLDADLAVVRRAASECARLIEELVRVLAERLE